MTISILLPDLDFKPVLLGGHPICDDGWDESHAKVACRDLYEDEDTEAIPISQRNLSSMKSSYSHVTQLWKANCTGTEQFLNECKITNSCKSGKAAGVFCITGKALKLHNGNEKNAGLVYLGIYPVCHDKWDMNLSHLVCKELHNVPAFEATSNTVLEHTTNSMIQVECQGSENSIKNCTYTPIFECKSNAVASVRCAKCTINDLLDVVNSVDKLTNFAEYKKKIATSMVYFVSP